MARPSFSFQKIFLRSLILLFALTTAKLGSAKTQVDAQKVPAGCNRICLLQLTENYLKALLTHDPGSLPFAANARYTENGSQVKIGEGLWKTAASLRAHQQFYQDIVSGNSLFRGVVEETGADFPAIVAVRIKAVSGKITEVEAIIARKGSHSTYAPDSLTTVNPVLTAIVPPDQRSSREKMIAVAESYWNGIEQRNSGMVLAVPGCDRIENGSKMTNRTDEKASATVKADCAGGASLLLQIKDIPERRYTLIDEERGIVIGSFIIDAPPRTTVATPVVSSTNGATTTAPGRMPLISEVFKIANGKIQYIEATLLNMPYGEVSIGW